MKRVLLLAALVLALGFGGALAQNQLVIVRPSDAVSLDANLETTAPGAWVFGNIVEPLITLNADMEIEPRLATSWRFISPTRLRFELRRGVSFHDGTPFNAQAVKFTWDRALRSDPPARWASLAGPITGVEVVDDFTVDVVTSEPYGPLLLTMTMVYTGIVSPAAVQRHGEDYGRNPVGTGPFRFVEWRTNDRIVIEANPNYWRGRPQIDRVVFRVVPEEGARMLALRSGQAHVVLQPAPADLAGLERDPNYEVISAPGLRVFYLGFNFAMPPMDDVRIRQAIHHAIDIDLISRSVLEGTAAPGQGILAPGVFGFHDMNLRGRYAYNPDLARELIRQAGYTLGADGLFRKDGQVLRLRMLPAAGRYLKDREIAEVVQEFLRRVGIQVDLDVFEWATTFTILRADPLEYHLFSFGWLTTTADADYSLYTLFLSSDVPPVGWNSWRFSNDRVDDLLRRARASVDAAEREALYREVQQILAIQVPAVPIYNTIEVIATGARVQGLVSHPIEYNLDLFPVSLGR